MLRLKILLAALLAFAWLPAALLWLHLGESVAYLAGIIVFGAWIALEVLLGKAKPSEFGLKTPSRKDAEAALRVFALFFVPAIALRLLVPEFDAWYAGLYGMATAQSALQLAVFVLPLALVFEEASVRGVLQSEVMRKYGKNVFGLLAVAAFFTLLHLPVALYSPNWVFSSAALGTILFYSVFISILYAQTRSLFATALLHALVNYVSVLQTVWHVEGAFAAETALWAAWGLLFLLYFRRNTEALQDWLKWFKPTAKLALSDYALLAAVALVPLLVFALHGA